MNIPNHLKKVKDVNWTKEQLEQFELDCKAEWETGSVLGPVHLSKGNEDMGQYDGGMISQLGLGASFISIFGSLYIYFVNEDQSLGIFVGLWAPTLILISREVDKMLGWMSE